MRSELALCALLSVSIAPAVVAAEDEAAESERTVDERAESAPEVAARASDDPLLARREVPDYDGRPEPGPSPEEMALWLPRALLSPIHFVFEYLLRRPLGWLLTTAERERWDVIQLVPLPQMAPTFGVAPTALFDFGLLPSVGLYLWLNDVVIPGNQFNVHIAFGGVDWLRASLMERQRIDARAAIELSFQAWSRPDNLFYGLGPNARSDSRSRYGRRSIQAQAALEVRPWRASHLRVSLGITANELFDTTYLDQEAPLERTLTDAVERGWFPELNGLPGGWPGYTAYWQRVEGSVDTRQPEPHSAGGFRVEGHVAHALDLARPTERRWLLWGGGVGGYVDVDRGRTLGLHSVASLATRLGSEEIPFTELPDLGDEMRMPGFLPGWMRGESATALVLDYRYPIGPALAGFVSAALGNAFGPLFDGFALGLLRMGFGIGIRTVGDPDQAFTITAGFGTETIDDGLAPTTFRLVLGAQRGF